MRSKTSSLSPQQDFTIMMNITPEEQRQANNFIQQILASHEGNQRLYGIIDAAQDERIYPLLKKKADIYLSLYNNDVNESLKSAGPVLFQFRQNDILSAWLIIHGQFNNWFILFASLGVTMIDMRRHFKRFAMVEAPNGKHMYFRYYDPRVLRNYLPSCNEEERKYIFGRFAVFWAQSQDQRYLRLTIDGGIEPLTIQKQITSQHLEKREFTPLPEVIAP